MKKFIFILFALATIVACNPSISGHITEIDSYGSLHTSFTIEDMLDKGFDYADLISVSFYRDDSLVQGPRVMPITTAFSEAGIGKPSYCHYSKRGEATFGYCQGDFHRICGGEVGDSVVISMYKKHGYKKIYKEVQAIYYTTRDYYPSDEAFANFREITTPGMKRGLVYRSGNPLNCNSNPVRCGYVDSLASDACIKTEIDIADTFDDIILYSQEPDFAGPYCFNLFMNGNTIPLGMGSDTFCDSAYEKFAEGMRFMLSHDGPYLIHCNEGKDRCGFYSMLLESLAGATIGDLEYDYMETYTNLYFMEPMTYRYNLNLSMTGDRLIYLMAFPEVIEDPDFDWSDVVVENIIPQLAAREFLIYYCGMSEEEVTDLELLLTE